MQESKRENEAAFQVLEDKVVFKGKWWTFKIVKYLLEKTKDQQHSYEYFESSKHEKGEVNSVTLIPIGYRAGSPERFLITIKNFRFPLGKFILEFPGGICESQDKKEEEALRELKEETGYTATKSALLSQYASPVLCVDPWKSSETEMAFPFFVNLASEENQKPKKELGEDELIEVVLFKLDEDIYANVLEYCKSNDCLMYNSLHHFLLGSSFRKISGIN